MRLAKLGAERLKRLIFKIIVLLSNGNSQSIKDKFQEVGARLRRQDLSRDSSTASITVLLVLDVQNLNKQARQD